MTLFHELSYYFFNTVLPGVSSEQERSCQKQDTV